MALHVRAALFGALVTTATAVADHVPFGPAQPVAARYGVAIDVLAADLDGDGDTDVIAAGWLDGVVHWWENATGLGDIWEQHVVAEGLNSPRSIQAIDMDGDSDLDLVVAIVGQSDVLWWENVDGCGTGWLAHIVDDNFDGAHGIFAADLDGDDDLDIAGAAVQANEISWWENLDGTGLSWAKHLVDQQFAGAFSVVCADLDGDSDCEIIATGVYADEISWWENVDGQGTIWSKHSLDNTFDGATDLFVIDMDGDLDLDVFGAAELDNEMVWWENTSVVGAVWIPHVIDAAFEGGHAIFPADIDNDGDLDVLGAAFFDADKVAWWENVDGSGSVWQRHGLGAAADFAMDAWPADLDGDGDLDIIGGLYSNDMTGSVVWWPNQLSQPAGPPPPGDGHCGCLADCAPAGGDGVVGILDLLLLLAMWGPGNSPPCDIAPAPGGDGVIGILDFLALLGSWGPCP